MRSISSRSRLLFGSVFAATLLAGIVLFQGCGDDPCEQTSTQNPVICGGTNNQGDSWIVGPDPGGGFGGGLFCDNPNPDPESLPDIVCFGDLGASKYGPGVICVSDNNGDMDSDDNGERDPIYCP
jgi:hypothetical protein